MLASLRWEGNSFTMSPELQTILDTLQKFADKTEAKAWYNKYRDEIIPLLADLLEEDENRYSNVIDDIIENFPHGAKGTKDEIHARVRRERAKRIDARLQDHWPDDEEVILEKDKDGLIVRNLPNIVMIIMKSKHLNLVYDSFTASIKFEVGGELPWIVSNDNMIEVSYSIEHKIKGVKSVKYHAATSHYHKAALKYYLSQFFTKELSWRMFDDAMIYAAHQNRVNIQQDYVNNGLPDWDLVDRMDILHRLAGVKNRVWAMIAMHALLGQMIARCFEPGYDMRAILILEGSQEIGKSLLCRALSFHESFYTQFIFDKNNHGYEVSRQLQGMAVVEFPDMGGIGNRDQNYIKAFFTATHDRNRKMHQDLVEHIDRIGVFIVTTNVSTPYFSDQTGNTRYIPVYCDIDWIDVDAIKLELPQLLAQAKYLWDQGVSPRLTDAEKKIRDEQVKPREMKSDYYHYMLDVLKFHRNDFRYHESENWDDGASKAEILGWCAGEDWWNDKPKHKHWEQIAIVLENHFHMVNSQKRIPAIRKQIDGPDVTGRKYRYAGNTPWDEFIDTLAEE